MTRVITALLFVLVTVSPALAQSTGTIAGVLTDEQTSAPLVPSSSSSGSITFAVSACAASAPASACQAAIASTDATGHYTIQNLLPGQYYLTATGTNYVGEVYPNVLCVSVCLRDQGTPVTVAGGATTTVDFALTKGGTIAGTVRRSDTGAGLGRTVFVYAADTRQVASVSADTQSGQYSVSALAPGNYYIRTGGSGGFIDVLYPNIACGSFSATCPLTLGATLGVATGATTTVDFALSSGGRITGTVTASDTGAPLGPSSTRSVQATAFSAGSPAATSVVLDATGQFAINGLPDGSYYLQACATGYACKTLTAPIAISHGSAASGVAIALDPAVAPSLGAISGTIALPGQFTLVCGRPAAYDTAGRLAATGRFVFTDARLDGYIIELLRPGTYYVELENPACATKFGPGGDTPDVIYGVGACVTIDCDVRRGTPVVVSAGATTSGVDFVVPQGGAIYLPVGDLLSAINRVELYDARGVRVTRRIRSPISTLFQVVDFPSAVGLPPGIYYARTTDGRLHPSLFCPDCPATAGQPILVTAGATVKATLGPGAADTARKISGVVRDETTQAPLANVAVQAFDISGSLASAATTDALGRFELPSPSFFGVTGIWTGGYFLRTGNLRGFEDRRYDALDCAGCEPTDATPITVGSTDVTGVTLSLPPAGSVALSTVDGNGVLLGAQTIALFDTSGRKVQRASVGSTGSGYVQMRPGTYYARTEPTSGFTMASLGKGTCVRGACNPLDGTPVAVTLTTPASIVIPVAACTPGDISPTIVASAVAGRPFRQVFTPTTPETYLYVSSGRLPAGLTLDAPTGALSGAPTESGVFNFSVASVDASGCVFVRQYTLQVAQCAFTLSAASATLPAEGGAVTVTASDVCGYRAISSQDAWITPDAASASASLPLVLTIGFNTSATARIGTVTIGRRVFTVRQAGQGSSNPFGAYDTPIDGGQVSGSIAVSGWALDDVEVARVRILRDPVGGEPPGAPIFIGNAVLVDGARPDVERAYPTFPFSRRAGWGYLLLTSMLPNHGDGTFRIHAIVDDAEGHSVELGVKTIVCVNAGATIPFGAIDTPAQGETVTGAAYRNWGWALTPNPKFISTNGSTIGVLIDGVAVGHPVYNLFRPDVAGLFPGLQNSGGPVGYRDVDTTALGEGVHTIAWVVTDSAGAGAGIGSRYFTVRNSADAQPSGLFLAPLTGQRAASLMAAVESTTYTITPLQRLSVPLPPEADDGCRVKYSGYLLANGELRDLPVGATLEGAEFTWQPGPAFRGRYEFAVVGTSCTGVRSRRTVIVKVGS